MLGVAGQGGQALACPQARGSLAGLKPPSRPLAENASLALATGKGGVAARPLRFVGRASAVVRPRFGGRAPALARSCARASAAVKCKASCAARKALCNGGKFLCGNNAAALSVAVDCGGFFMTCPARRVFGAKRVLSRSLILQGEKVRNEIFDEHLWAKKTKWNKIWQRVSASVCQNLYICGKIHTHTF